MAHAIVWQVDASAPWCFMDWNFAEDHGFDFGEYDPVYETSVDGSGLAALEDLFYRLNMDHPAGYAARSLSMSDIVELDGGYWYCDAFGWEDITADIVSSYYGGRPRKRARDLSYGDHNLFSHCSDLLDMIEAEVTAEAAWYLPDDVLRIYDEHIDELVGLIDYDAIARDAVDAVAAALGEGIAEAREQYEAALADEIVRAARDLAII